MEDEQQIPEQVISLNDVKWFACNKRYDDPVPSMEAVSEAVEAVIEYLIEDTHAIR